MACPKLRLSKSQFIKGHQCPLALWYFKHRKDLIPPIDAAKQALFDSGHDVGELAKQIYPNGLEIKGKFFEITKFVNDTQTAIANGETVIYEAAACTAAGLYSRIDILKKNEIAHQWDLIEVKSSTSVKEYHLDDMAVQLYSFEQAGFPINRCHLMHVNNQFVKNGEINPEDLFVAEDITEIVRGRLDDVAKEVNDLIALIDTKEAPEKPIGPHCDVPFECDFKHHCWKHIPEYSVYSLFRGEKLRELVNQNISRLQDIPTSFELTDKQQIDIKAYRRDEIYKEESNIKAFLDTLTYPLYYLDYETLSNAIPLVDHTSPYQQVPFQYSLHIQKKPGGKLEHKAFLYEGNEDPRATLIPQLIKDCGQSGSVVVYYKAFEATRNKEMAEAYPDDADALLALNERMVDLWVPFNSRYLYSPAMKSSASIKKVLPAFVPDMNYDDLEIKEGESAARLYGDCFKGKVSDAEKKKLLKALLVYCEQDTLAMVKLLEVLEQQQSSTPAPIPALTTKTPKPPTTPTTTKTETSKTPAPVQIDLFS